MKDRLFIATQMAAGFMSGVPLSGTDLEDWDLNPDTFAEVGHTVRAIAKISLMMADALIEADQCSQAADSKTEGTK